MFPKNNQPASSLMDLTELFRLPERSQIAAFAEAQVQLYRHDPSLQDYFLPLQLSFGLSPASKTASLSLTGRIRNLAANQANRIIRAGTRRKYKVDVLYCPTPYYSRRSENQLTLQTLLGLAQMGATVLCLLPQNSPCRAEIKVLLETQIRSGQVTLLDPLAPSNAIAARLIPRLARERGRTAFTRIMDVLQPVGIVPPENSRSAVEHIAQFVEAWSSIEPYIEFDAVISRCHWLALCSPVGRTAIQRGKPVITFQQGVIDLTLDTPVSASRYVSFGNCSAGFLARMNRAFFHAVGKAEPIVDFIPGGSLFDKLLDLPDQFENRAVLVMDDPDPNDFYGLDIHRRGVLRLTEKILQSGSPLHRVIIRPHPYWANLDLEPWKQLVRDYPDSCELSHPAWTLEEDLKRASAVVGNFSGALTVAAASGLPTFFLETDCYATEDLACFRAGQMFPPDEAFREIRRVLTDASAYAEARSIARRNARDYYADGANLKLDGPFFERMLRFDSKMSLSSQAPAK